MKKKYISVYMYQMQVFLRRNIMIAYITWNQRMSLNISDV